MADLVEAADLFTNAVQDFQNALPQKERQVFQNYQNKEAMLRDLTRLCSNHQASSKLSQCCLKVAKFSDSFEPYFDIINIFVQVKPEYMGILWGSIRLIFQLGTNHVTFLERVSDLFGTLSLSLPQYQQHYETCRKRIFASIDRSRLMKLMTFVYEDVVAFCGDVCLILGRRSGERKIKRSWHLMQNTMWKPFDSRFSQLQERMQRHQDLFDQEMRLYDREILTQHFEDFQQYLEESEKVGTRDREKERAEVKRSTDHRFRSLRKWIWNLEHRSTYERAVRRRHPGSCDWLLEKPRYLTWRDHLLNGTANIASGRNKMDWVTRVLSLQANPGFGKTILSTAIIDDLENYCSTHARHSDSPPVLAFFHFNGSARGGSKTSAEAFRALAAQLIDLHRNDSLVMDALSILFDQDAVGQQQASADQISAILRILIQGWPTFLVIDGVDECSDSSHFLSRLWEILIDLECHVLLLSRPNLTFRYSNYDTQEWQMQLSTADNMAGIQSFLRYQFDIMTDELLFGPGVVDNAVVDDLAQRSNGMFLWVRLLVAYLKCPALSPMERLATLREVNLLEGLGRLYKKMLDTLDRSYEKQRHLAADIFKWLSFSLYPLGHEELHEALAIIPGDPTNDLQRLRNYPRCVQQITCALVEVDVCGTISFIHSSFKEFLEKDPSCPSLFSFRDQQAIHERFATTCISYLLHDLPGKPLRRLERWLSLESGVESCGDEVRFEHRLATGDNKALILKNYPFLKYASLCWSTHLIKSMSSQNQPQLSKQGLQNRQSSRFSSMQQVQDDDAAGRLHAIRSSRHTNLALHTHPPMDHGAQIYKPRDRNLQRLCSIDQRWGSTHSNHSALAPITPQLSATPTNPSLSEQPIWVPLLSEFLLHRLSVTTWVEACWTFNFAPDLSHLDPLLQTLSSDCCTSSSEDRETMWVSAGVHQLSEALKGLRERHRELLLSNPTLIWQEHIASATDPVFWPLWEEHEHDQLDVGRGNIVARAGFVPQYDLSPAPSGGMSTHLPIFL